MALRCWPVPRGTMWVGRMAGNQKKYRRFLARLPWMKRGIYVRASAAETYAGVMQAFINEGFSIAAADDRLMRFCVYHRSRSSSCSCLYIVWIRRTGPMTYVSYGIEPKFLSFLFCRRLAAADKIDWATSIVRSGLPA